MYFHYINQSLTNLECKDSQVNYHSQHTERQWAMVECKLHSQKFRSPSVLLSSLIDCYDLMYSGFIVMFSSVTLHVITSLSALVHYFLFLLFRRKRKTKLNMHLKPVVISLVTDGLKHLKLSKLYYPQHLIHNSIFLLFTEYHTIMFMYAKCCHEEEIFTTI